MSASVLRAVPRFAVPAALLVLGSCSEQELTSFEPEFVITWAEADGFVPGDLEASTLALGTVTTGELRAIEVQLANVGNATLEMCEVGLSILAFDDAGRVTNEVRVESDLEIGLTPSFPPGPLLPESSRLVRLAYTPLFGQPVAAGLHLVVKHEKNWDCAAGSGEGLYVPVLGAGEGQPVPDIYSKPAFVDFGTLLPGSDPPSSEVLIGNSGPGNLEIGTIHVEPATNFSVETGTVPGSVLGTGQWDFVTVTYQPQSQGIHAANLVVASNDADEDPLRIPLYGTADPEDVPDPGDDDDDATPGGSGFPIAMCGSTIFANPLEVVQLSSFSVHTGGFLETLSLQPAWVLTTRPPGSVTTLANANTANPATNPYVDLVGTYVGTLTVTDSAGLTSSCNQTIEVLPPENFRVELFWDVQDDFDLHVLEANDGSGNQGSPWSSGDCYFSNCQGLGLDWGQPGNTYDNPYLDLDDIPGTGPENTNITDPALAPYEGWYRVMVHDYTGSTTDNYGTTNGTLNIYLNQVLVQTYGFSMSGDGDEYWVARIQWPSGQVQACAGLGGCP